MRTLHNYLDAAKQRREDGEAGFSLIELIVVVAILGILVAIAIPVFTGIQATATTNVIKTAAANGATEAAAEVANSGSIATGVDFPDLSKNGLTVKTAQAATSTDDVCVSATNGTETWFAGPGANTAGTACG